MYKFLFDNNSEQPNLGSGYIYKNEFISENQVREDSLLEIDVSKVQRELKLDADKSKEIIEIVVKSIYRMKTNLNKNIGENLIVKMDKIPNQDDLKKALDLMHKTGIVITDSQPKNIISISFDFDGCLSTEPMQELCKKFIKLGANVFVTTTRSLKVHDKLINHDDLFQVTDNLGIDRKNIVFTKYEDKYSFVKDMDFHIDDDENEIFLINQHPSKCMGFLYEQFQSSANGIKEW